MQYHTHGDHRMKQIAPSILSADFAKLGAEISEVEKAGADMIHVDVMDGHFVPNITIGPLVVNAVRKVTDLPLDVHLMIENADRFVPEFIKAGADIISVHVESCIHLNRTLQVIKNAGCRTGVVLNPSTPLSSLDWVLEYSDVIMLMSVNPGFGGQSFIPNTLERIRCLRQMIEKKGLPTLVEIDGGVNATTIADISNAGADIFVAGSAIFGSDNYQRTMDNLKKLAGNHRDK
jgi:ribulose-phosphate 3-epimerase